MKDAKHALTPTFDIDEQNAIVSCNRCDMSHLNEFPAHQFRYMRYCGIVERPTRWYRFRKWFSFILVGSFMPLHVLYLVENPLSDLVVTCEEVMLIQLMAIDMLKFNLFISHHHEMRDLVECFKRMQKCITADELPRFAKCNEVHAKLLRFYVIGSTIVVILYALNAIVTSVTLSIQQHRVLLVTPFSYPFSYQHPVVFAVCFLLCLDFMMMCVYTSATIDVCYSEMATNLAIHFDIVGERFERLDISADQPFADSELNKVISYHSDVSSLAQKMTRLLKTYMFYCLLLVSTILCLLGYEFVMVGNISKRAQVMLLAGVVIGQAVIHTYHGSAIRDHSVNVADSIYSTNWYDATITTRKQILICLMRAQQPVIIKSGFIEASLPTLKTILNSSASYITMLMSLESED
ncbi:odorant receptor 82a-like [Anopheles marshallii]|uniref:odorant receptor 82a-like n=1 Tax=Anopheles marshallii TaxID=1521116 RepID=UPI00237C19F4|nr:odorant receptor 82a-like [Anopheles marshallii]